MNLLTVSHYPVFGGPHNEALRLAAPLKARGWHTTVLLPDEPGNAAPRLQEAGVDVVPMPLHRLRASPDPRVQAPFALGLLPEVARIRRLLRRRRVDLVQLSGLVNPHAAFAARLEGLPIVWQLLDTRPPMALRRLVMPLVTGLSDAVMSCGVEVGRVHPGAERMGERLVYWYPPVDTRLFTPDPARRTAARAELGVPEGTRLIGTVANLNPMKGHEYLVRAAAIVRRHHPDVAVRILGARTPTHTAYETRVRAEARSLGLLDGGTLRFVAPEARVPELLPAFDIFLLTSVPRSEGMPTVILEAMACGVPVISTRVGSVAEVVEDDVTGMVVPPLDPEAIAGATLRLLTDRDLRARFAAEGRRRVVERYDVQICADRYLRAFEIACAHRRARGRETRASGAPAATPAGRP